MLLCPPKVKEPTWLNELDAGTRKQMGSMIARMTRPAKEKEDGDIYISLAEMLDPFNVSVSCTCINIDGSQC